VRSTRARGGARGEAAALVLVWKILSVRYCGSLTVFPEILENVSQFEPYQT
jgi:hypothetical protein